MSDATRALPGGLRLRLRTPRELLLDQPVSALTAEDLDGWFGLAPGHADLVAVLPPGLLLFRDDAGEGFVALSGGLLELSAGECRVMARDALVARELESVADELDRQLARRSARAETQSAVIRQLVSEAVRRLVQEGRR